MERVRASCDGACLGRLDGLDGGVFGAFRGLLLSLSLFRLSF